MSFDVAAARRAFSPLGERSYMAQQCFGLLPDAALDDFDAYRRSLSLRNRCLDEWLGRYEEMHARIEELLAAPRGSVFLRDTATAVQAAVASCLRPEGLRRRVIVSSADFHSSRHLWRAQSQRGFEIVEVHADGPEHADAQSYLDAIDERTAVVALSLVSPRSGALLDASAIAERARAAGAVFVLDAYQAVGVVPTRVAAIGAHVVVGGSHKWLGGGGTGLAFGYVEPDLAEGLTPPYPGWLASESLLEFSDHLAPHPGARKLAQGTPAIEPIYTARAGLAFVMDTGIDSLRARSMRLTERLAGRAREHGIRLHSPSDPENRGGMICLDVPYEDAQRAVAALGERGIDVDARPGAGIRIGPHPCVTEEECDRAIDAVVGALRTRSEPAPKRSGAAHG